MKNSVCNWIGMILIITGLVVFLSPMLWAFTDSPWYFLLFLISWIPALLLFYVGSLFLEE